MLQRQKGIYRTNYIVKRVVVVIALVDFTFVSYYVFIMFDSHASIHWYYWFVTIHFMNVVLAISNALPFIHVHTHVGCILTLVSVY